MQMKWQIDQEEKSYQLNFSAYSSLFVNHTMNEEQLIHSLINFFQPRSIIKNTMTITDKANDFDEINHHSFTAFEFSGQLLKEETKLRAKSLLKAKLKDDFFSHIETDGYLLTINTLIDDLFNTVVDQLPIKTNDLTIDSLLKLIEIDFSSLSEETNVLSRSKRIINSIVSYLNNKHHHSLILFFSFPELYLSPKEQLAMKRHLIEISKDMHVFVITNSKYFIADDIGGNNYFLYENQLLTDEFFNDLEWESPLPFTKPELINATQHIIKNYVDNFEMLPSISNYRQADIVIFNSIDLYVLVFILKKLSFHFQLDIDFKLIDKPVAKYVMDVYENV